MRFEAALINEQGVTFAVIPVKDHVLQSHNEADKMIRNFGQKAFPSIPVILMGKKFGRTMFHGRPDIAKFLASIPITSIPWKTFTISD